MERLTEKYKGENTIPLFKAGKQRWTLYRAGIGYLAGDAADRLAAYEDTGLEPEEIIKLKSIESWCDAVEHELEKYMQLEKAGRLVVLDSPRLPLVLGDVFHDIVLCPNCNHDLMGGFRFADSGVKMYQCPYCGQPVDDAKVQTREEAEAATEKMKEEM